MPECPKCQWYEAAIRKHRDQRGDDRCWMDDEELYKTLPEGFVPPVREVAVEIGFCQRFIESRRHPATEYVSPQREVERLAAENEKMKAEVAALRVEADELRSAREFYQDRWEIEERVNREMRDAIRGAGFSTQYFDKQLYCFPETAEAAKLRDRIAETVYEMARHLRDLINKPPDLAVWQKKADGLLLKLRAIDFRRFQKEMDRP